MVVFTLYNNDSDTNTNNTMDVCSYIQYMCFVHKILFGKKVNFP